MMKWNRFLAMLLALLLLSGCGTGAETETTTPVETPAPVETTVPDMTTAPAQTEMPTEPAVTEPPETEPVPEEVELSKQERYEINIFLSNFSEQQFRDIYWPPNPDGGVFCAAEADVYEILYFVWNHTNYNTYQTEDVQKDGEWFSGISLELISSKSERFFGRPLTKEDVEQAGRDFRLIDGLVCRPMAFGDSYLEMAAADALYDLGNGTMRVDFTVYSPTIEAEYDGITSAGGINSRDIYYYTPREVVDSGYFVPYRKGTALVKPKTLENGRESYELLTYELLDTE